MSQKESVQTSNFKTDNFKMEIINEVDLYTAHHCTMWCSLSKNLPVKIYQKFYYQIKDFDE